jgi:hypothetical protein
LKRDRVSEPTFGESIVRRHAHSIPHL